MLALRRRPLTRAGRDRPGRVLGALLPCAALAAGAAFPLGFAPYDLWPLTVAAMAALCALLCRPTARPLREGWLFGVGKYGVGVHWIYVSIHVHGNAEPWLAAALVGLFVAGMAVFHGIAAWVFVRLRRSGAGGAFAFAAVWTLGDWVLTWFLTGFPWLFPGYAMLDTPLQALAPVGGVLLVGFAAALTGAGLAHWRSGGALALAALPWLAGLVLANVAWTTPGAAGTAALVQGAVPQETKWQPGEERAIQARYAALSAAAWESDLVLWPEAAITTPLHRAEPFLRGVAERASGALVLGVMIAERSPAGWAWHNGAVARADGEGRYLKRRLVPFGEYVPLAAILRGLIDFFDLPMSRLEPGHPRQPLLRAGAARLGMSICYEIAFPELVRASAADADVLATLSNDTWFGASIGPVQHLQIARMRALENGRFLLRATNDGITAIIGPDGKVVDALPRFAPGVLRGEWRTMQGTTPFTRWGGLPLVALLLALAALGVVRRAVGAVYRSGGRAGG